MYTKKFKEFLSQEIDMEGVEKLELLDLFTIDVRAKKPSFFANCIMFWCWVRSRKLRKVGWKKRWHHCVGVEIFQITWKTGDIYTIAISYDAVSPYRRKFFKDLMKGYEIINISNTSKTLSIDTEAKRKIVHDIHESLVGSPYGNESIAGIVVSDSIRVKVIGVDGKEKVICSEAEMWSLKDFILSEPNEPYDHIDVIERGLYVPMTPYNNELEMFY